MFVCGWLYDWQGVVVVGHWWVVIVGSCGHSWCCHVVAGWCGWLSLSGCHVTPGWCQKGDWEGWLCLLTWAGNNLITVVLACCQPGVLAGDWHSHIVLVVMSHVGVVVGG